MSQESPPFYSHPQSEALTNLLPILQTHLPHSNGIYNRMRAPVNIPSRHCLFAATFPPSSLESTAKVPEVFTIFFADRSRHEESQIWIFNSLITLSSPLSSAQEKVLESHATQMILYLRDFEIPEAPGWPFSPILRFACVHERLAKALKSVAVAKEALLYTTVWNCWNIYTSNIISTKKRPLQEGFIVSRVPESQLDIVLSTSTIPRQPSTMLGLPNVGLLNAEGKLVAWSYIGLDGAFITLYVLPQYRGNGFASYIAVEILSRLDGGKYADLGFDGETGLVYAAVKLGNEESERVMKSLGGNIDWLTSYIRIDSEKF